MFSLSDLDQTKLTGLFGCFGLELKQRFVRPQVVLMIYPSFKRIIYFFPDGGFRGRRDGVSLFLLFNIYN